MADGTIRDIADLPSFRSVLSEDIGPAALLEQHLLLEEHQEMNRRLEAMPEGEVPTATSPPKTPVRPRL